MTNTNNDAILRNAVLELVMKNANNEMTYKEFAEKIGFKENDIIQLIRHAILSMDLLDAICEYFKIEKTESFLKYVTYSK